ncbi:unnamed protein product [Dovyalis caffra]|uniref:Uncharacterized protein n=1 Tax=Dovyalis caffra TaxID=77055 RepID=A0AAV1QPI7_9ROSI|nr:unnamed protein product [Dovyalis caffra]
MDGGFYGWVINNGYRSYNMRRIKIGMWLNSEGKWHERRMKAIGGCMPWVLVLDGWASLVREGGKVLGKVGDDVEDERGYDKEARVSSKSKEIVEANFEKDGE